jgi:hypothetical protein
VSLPPAVRVLLVAILFGILFVPLATALTATPTPTRVPCALGATCEAENAARGGGVTISTQHAGYTGGGFIDYQNNGTGYVEWTVTVPTAGQYALAFRYGNGGTTDRPMAIAVNGTTVIPSLSFPSTTSWTNWTLRTQNLNLPAGYVRIRATELPNGPNVDSLKVTASAPPTATFTYTATATRTPTPTATRTPTATFTATATSRDLSVCLIGELCEAERMTRGGGVVISTQHAGYTGGGFADYQGNGTGYVEWKVQISSPGTYTLKFRYGNGGTTDRPMAIAVNGTTVFASLSFPSTTTWTNWTVQSVNVTLPAGQVLIRATELPNGPNVDSLTVSTIAPTPTQWVTGYMKIAVSKVDPKVGEAITVTVSGNTGLGSYSLQVVGDPIFAQPPASPSGGGTSYTWTLTALQPGKATFLASTYGETQNGCNSCFIWRTVAAAAAEVIVPPTTSPTATPAPQAFVSNSVWYTYGQDVLVRADTTASATNPSWTFKVIDTATGLEQDPANPIVTLDSQGPPAPTASGSVQWWRFTPRRSGAVRFETTVNAEFPCGSGCYQYKAVTATSWGQQVTVP